MLLVRFAHSVSVILVIFRLHSLSFSSLNESYRAGEQCTVLSIISDASAFLKSQRLTKAQVYVNAALEFGYGLALIDRVRTANVGRAC